MTKGKVRCDNIRQSRGHFPEGNAHCPPSLAPMRADPGPCVRAAEGSAFTDFMDPDAGMSTSFGGGGGGGGMAGGGTMDTSTASLPKPVE